MILAAAAFTYEFPHRLKVCCSSARVPVIIVALAVVPSNVAVVPPVSLWIQTLLLFSHPDWKVDTRATAVSHVDQWSP